VTRLSIVLALVAAVWCPAPAVFAQTAGTPAPGLARDAGPPASSLPAPLREIGFDQNLDRRLPLDTTFADEEGRTVRLGDYFGRRPVVLAFVYYDCPMLCTLVLNAMASSLDVLSLQPGSDFEIVTISFDPREKPALAAAKKASYLQRYHRPGAAAAWHFLTGDQESIDRTTKAAGFRYVWDERLKQYAHPTGLIVLTPDGRAARYLFGIEYGPRDLRLAIVDASAGRVGSKVDAFLLYCYHYDPMTGRYGLAIMRTMRIAGAATVLALLGFIAIMLRRERRADRRSASSSVRNPAPGTALSTAPRTGAPGTAHPARGTR
jgi:protein SCO1/2